MIFKNLIVVMKKSQAMALAIFLFPFCFIKMFDNQLIAGFLENFSRK